MIHLLERGVLRLAAVLGESSLDALEAPHELGVGIAQGRFRIDAKMPREIRHDEKEVAELLDDALRWSVVHHLARLVERNLKLGDLLFGLGDHRREARPIE